jgi:redox-sensitive bicupin YhaK (pirin superfamily)
MSPRSVSRVVYAPEHQMGPLTVRQPLPSEQLEYLDPFVLLHHAPYKRIESGQIGAHPHRGFSPVTFIFTGSIHHRDSKGHDSIVSAGGTQWMHAGSGILHEESPLPGDLELIQLWINSPARHKTDPPSYHPLAKEQTPQVTSGDNLVAASVVAGNLNGVNGPIPTLTPINAAMVHARRGGRISLSIPATHNAFVYVLAGTLTAPDGTRVPGFHQAVFAPDGGAIEIEALEDARALLMSGEPIGEPIVSSGPFVMNTEEEIRQAFRDYRAGLMGELGDRGN